MSPQETDAHGVHHKFHIVINTRAFEVEGPKITYREIVNLAFPADSGEIIYLIHFSAPPHSEGTVKDGHSVKLVNGMVFDVSPTNRS